ncbi:MAG: VOC family protein [Myxococcota bacterium]
MAIQRVFYNVLSADLAAARRFYCGLLELSVRFDSDWFVHVGVAGNEGLEIGLLARDHALVPEAWRGAPRGAVLTVVVDDVDRIHEQARAAGVEVVEPPTDQFYGQRRLLLRDPDGTLVDLSSECAPDPAWLAKVQPIEGGGYREG